MFRCVNVVHVLFLVVADRKRNWSESGMEMSDDGDIDVESAEDVPDIAVEATATTAEDRSELYSPKVSLLHFRALSELSRISKLDKFYFNLSDTT